MDLDVKGLFISAKILKKKDSDKPPWLLVNIFMPYMADERDTGGEVKEIFISPEKADEYWKMVKEARFGWTVTIRKAIVTRGKYDKVDYEVLAVEE